MTAEKNVKGLKYRNYLKEGRREIKYNIRLSQEEKDTLQNIALQKGVSISTLIMNLVSVAYLT